MNSSPHNARPEPSSLVLGAGLGLGLVAVGYILGKFLALGCSENVEAGTVRGDVCEDVGEPWSLTWWFAVLWPVVLFALTQLLPLLRRHSLAVAAVIGLMTAAFWTGLLLAVTGNLGS